MVSVKHHGAVAQSMQYVGSGALELLMCVDHDEHIKSNHRVGKLNLDVFFGVGD